MSGERDIETIRAIERLDRRLSEVVQAGDVTIPAGPAAHRALENLWMARRTLGSIRLLMSYTATGKDYDRTEDAAVLVRRLLELFADTVWMTDWEGLDPDSQALRSILADLDERRKALDFIIEMDRDRATVERAKQELQEQAAQVAQIERALSDLGARNTRRESTFDILRRVDRDLAFFWRHESDVAHGGLVGRGLQRSETFYIGADAPPWRRNQVLDRALSLGIDIAGRCLRLMKLKPEVEADARDCPKPPLDPAQRPPDTD